MKRVLVAGIGNVFLTDDGFGVEASDALARRPLPSGVRVADFGIRGVHLAYELLDGCDVLVMLDAVDLRDAPGTLAVIEVDGDEEDATQAALDAHTMSPQVVLATLRRLGGRIAQVYVIGCQPENLDEGMGLTPSVAGAVERAADLCLELLADIDQVNQLVGRGEGR
ncbi:MAG: hydrogenase maturation protease [Acidimicrobiales bacterium]